jgi:glycosyltransferase involved in cell wall biosynthesis
MNTMEVSVIIPVYNAEHFVEEAVLSALDQQEVGEVLVIEDGSSDNSLRVCQKLSEEHSGIRLLQHPGGTNRGAAASRNLGILHARSDYISFLDADDWYLPGRFSTAREVFEREAQADGVYEAVAIEFSSDEAGAKWYASGRGVRGDTIITVTKPLKGDELLATTVTGYQGRFHTNGIVVKRSLFEKTGLFDEELVLHQDSAMWIKMAAVGQLFPGSIGVPVAVRRVYGSNRVLTEWPPGHNPYKVKELEILCSWAKNVNLSKHRMNILLRRRWVESLLQYDEAKRRKLMKLNELSPDLVRWLWKSAFVGTLLIRQPRLLFSRHPLMIIFEKLFGRGRQRDLQFPASQCEPLDEEYR